MCSGQVGGVSHCSNHYDLLRCGQTLAPMYPVLTAFQCICSTFECKCSCSFIQFFMKHLFVLMSWPEDMDMLWMKFLSFVSVFCSVNLSCSMIVHIDKKCGGGGA